MEKYTHILIDNQVSWHPQCWRNICINASWGRWKNSQNNHSLQSTKSRIPCPIEGGIFAAANLQCVPCFDQQNSWEQRNLTCILSLVVSSSIIMFWASTISERNCCGEALWLKKFIVANFRDRGRGVKKLKSRRKYTYDSNFRLLIIVTKFWRFVWTSCHIL